MITLTEQQWERLLSLVPRARLAKARTGDILSDIIPLLDHATEPVLILKYWQDFPDWAEGKYPTGRNCLYDGYPYVALAPGHDSTGNPGWNPTIP